jgi:hypothetical protein
MLRIVSSVVAVAAFLAIPFSQADARHGGMSGGRSFSAGSSMRMSSMRSGPRIGSFNTIRSASVIGTRRAFIGNHRNHHRRFFVGVGAYGLYDTCWRWVPTAYGLRRVWVCDPYSYY